MEGLCPVSLAGKISQAVQDHPVSASALGMTALIMKAETLLSALIIAILFCLVLGLSALSVAGLRRLIPAEYRLVYILVISSTWVGLLDMVTASLFFGMSLHLSIYLPLMALNGLLLLELESRALKSSFSVLLPRLITTCLIVSTLLVTTGLAREWLAKGALLTDMGLIGMPSRLTVADISFFTLPLAGTAVGAFIIFGSILALMNAINHSKQLPKDASALDETNDTGSISGH